ncbi:DnaJ domain-containing protein [Marinobacter sp. JSM 1782161]|uniref:DnaJ domain-containing protein n=1 Tax=Marinobacter sp. JSM 1782161 TaxID=2685906 RepID=UPI001403AF0F|nr:DnaJ domain-containing protein [Marinobacter sp. JSM 1782161]
MHWILGIGLTVLAFYMLRHWGDLPEEKRKAYLFRGLAGGFVLLMLLLLLTGRIHVLVAAVGALLPFLRKLPALLKYLPLANRLYRDYKGGANQGQQQAGGTGARPGSGRMSVEQAREILGLEASASRDDVIAAHRRLIQKVHPDRGGNDFLAAQINEAKAVLLDRQV